MLTPVRKEFTDRPQELQSFIQRKSPTGSISSDAQKIIDDATDVIYGERKLSKSSESLDMPTNTEITRADIESVHGLERKSLANFGEDDFKKTTKFEYHFWNELKKKSPFYRAKYGDWRESETETKKPVIKVDTDTIKSFRGKCLNEDTDWEIMVSSVGIGDTISHSGKQQLSVLALNNIKEIIENAVLLDSEPSAPSKKKGKNTLFMHKLYALTKIGGKVYLAKLSVEEYASGNKTEKRLYNLAEIKMSSALGGLGGKSAASTVRISDDAISVAELFELVKRYDPNFQSKGEKRKESLSKSDTEESIFDADVPMLHIDGSVRTSAEYRAEQEATAQAAEAESAHQNEEQDFAAAPGVEKSSTDNPDVAAIVNADGNKRTDDIELQYSQRLKGKNSCFLKIFRAFWTMCATRCLACVIFGATVSKSRSGVQKLRLRAGRGNILPI